MKSVQLARNQFCALRVMARCPAGR